MEAGAGPAVVLLHGGGGGGANWYRLLPALCSAGFRVLAPDLPGFGLSEPVPPRRPLGLQAAASLDAWLDAVVPDPVVLVGTSLGALAALRLAQLRPRRIAGMALVGAVGLGRAVAWPLRAGGLRAFSPLLGRPSRRGSEWVFRRLMVSDSERVPRREREALLDYLYEVDRAGAARTVARSLHYFAGPTGQRERLGPDELRAIALPVLLVWGSEDRFVPVRHGRRAAAVLPRGTLRVLPDCGHSPNWEAPDALLDVLLPFLRARLAPGGASP